MRYVFILFIFIAANLSVVAQESTVDKIVSLREKIKSYFSDMPRLNFRQKFRVGGIIKKHRKDIRAVVDEIRPHVVSMRREICDVLTREQLLKIINFQNELILRTKGEKAAIILQKMSKEHRTQLLNHLMDIHKSDATNLEIALDRGHEFKMSILFPYVAQSLELTVDQQQQVLNIIEKHRSVLKPLVVKLIHKIRKIKQETKSHLSLAQINFLEANKQKIFQEVIKFVNEL